MKRVIIHKPGGYERLKIENMPTPEPKPDQVLVKNHASGVNYADVAVRWGVYESAKKYVGWPITPGFEFAGVVEKMGDQVQGFKVGDRVFGITLFGGYSSHVVVDQNFLFHIPERFSFEQAAGFPAVYLTAYHALFQHVRVREKMDVLIHSAAGGVGSALLSLGQILKLNMIGVVGSSHKVAKAKSRGAHHVIDKSTENLWQKAEEYCPGGYDIILDANGASTLKESYQHLKSTGKLISYGFHSMLPKKGGHINYLKLAYQYLKTPRFNPIHMTNENKSVITFNVSFLMERLDYLKEGMQDMLAWIDEGKIDPPETTLFPVEQVAKAHAAIESGQTTGKLILTF